jgi:23S rRNA pseudouridine1911/1915/1917 synthase
MKRHPYHHCTLNQGYAYRHILGPESEGHCVVTYMVEHFRHSNTFQWQERLEAGELVLNAIVAQGGELVKPGDVVIWNRPAWLEPATPQHYQIVYRDEHLLVVDKPSGLPTIPGGGFYLNTLLSMVQKDFHEARPMHRLGRATSGLVVFALDHQTASQLAHGWPSVLKQYIALAVGHATDEKYDIQMPIGPVPHARLGYVHAASDFGKPSRTVARVLKRQTDSIQAATTLFELDLHTGRPHQIRIHLATIGHPLVGDPMYGVGGQPKLVDPGLPGDGGYHLHARRIVLTHPVNRDQLDLRSEEAWECREQ